MIELFLIRNYLMLQLNFYNGHSLINCRINYHQSIPISQSFCDDFLYIINRSANSFSQFEKVLQSPFIFFMQNNDVEA